MIKKIINQAKRSLLLVCVCGWGLSATAQSGTYGNTFVHSGTEAAIHMVNQTFALGGGAPLDGIVGTERVSPLGYLSFVGTASWSGASDAQHVDGYVKTYMSSAFVFPIGDNGRYRPVRVSTSSSTAPLSAAYYNANPTTAITSSLRGGNEPALPTGTYNSATTATNVKNVSTAEYWDINGTTSAQITLTWNTASGVSAMTGGTNGKLSIVGWNIITSRWEAIESTVDAVSILGGASSLSSGSITTSTSIVPNTYEVYTLAGLSYVKPTDTTITPRDTTRIVLGPAVIPDSNIIYSVSGPFRGSGLASIDPKTGVVTFIPSSIPFIGRDTIYKIRCVKTGITFVCDSTRIIIDGKSYNRPVFTDSTAYNTGKVLADLPPINTGGKPYTTSTTSSAGSTVSIGANGKVNYQPKDGYTGYDTVRVLRCVDGICDIVTYIIYVKPLESLAISNYISPNGDGLNDVWNIDAILVNYPNAKASIYNRWGNIVWRSTGPYGKAASKTNVWYGQLEGSESKVPDGVYYYLLELEDKFRTTKTGFIELMRK
jgi:gliding motility-associated-like protein